MLNDEGWNEVSTYVIEVSNSPLEVYTSCYIRSDNVNNWLRTPFINVQGSKSLYIETKFTMRKCARVSAPGKSSHCRESFNLYSYQTDRDIASKDMPSWDDISYNLVDKVAATCLGESASDVLLNTETRFISLKRGLQGIYFAFQDLGSCVSLVSVKVYYKICPEITHHYALYPATPAGKDISSSVEVEGQCVPNSSIFERPVYRCMSDGTWDIAAGECRCNPGYQGTDNRLCVSSCHCDHGKCHSNLCICSEGWSGKKCDNRGGSRTHTGIKTATEQSPPAFTEFIIPQIIRCKINKSCTIILPVDGKPDQGPMVEHGDYDHELRVTTPIQVKIKDSTCTNRTRCPYEAWITVSPPQIKLYEYCVQTKDYQRLNADELCYKIQGVQDETTPPGIFNYPPTLPENSTMNCSYKQICHYQLELKKTRPGPCDPNLSVEPTSSPVVVLQSSSTSSSFCNYEVVYIPSKNSTGKQNLCFSSTSSTQQHCMVVDVQGQSLNDSIKVSCSQYSWDIVIDLNILRQIYPGLITSNIYLGENRCTGIETKRHLLFKYGLHECLTHDMQIDGNNEYINELIYAEHDPVYTFIIRNISLTFPVECGFSKNIINTMSDNSSNVFFPSEQYPVNISTYSDSNFMKDIPDSPIYAAIGSRVYVKVFSTTPDWSTTMKVNTCYTKPEVDAPDHLKYYFIKNGCEMDASTHIIAQTTHETRFVFVYFEYMDRHNKGLYVFCDAIFCRTSDMAAQCLQTCNPVRRRNND
ncbi:uncharacterized protein LOC123559084 [Mercenaria mercenaria]|uniref:uncharacterized protein LOC123559084 n=1 Tax=Mercenaria mercenaria TaxID=6596 RepID=UPI00234F05E3|nr:uncharacterized protein LOC123559084 [Mercenaria mercenaria]